ncbi:hypothetical protein B7463_g11589, partial [Scytalidium lignicola]
MWGQMLDMKLGHETVVKLLLEAGAGLEVKGENGWTPLFYASFRGHEAVVKVLLQAGALANTIDRNGVAWNITTNMDTTYD